MTDQLTLESIDASVRDSISKQSQEKQHIEGVTILTLTKYTTEDGSFTEILRLNDHGNFELMPDFHIGQINRSVMLPNTVKAWHLHYGQDEIWNVSSRSHLMLGLWDVRENSPTKGQTMRIPMSPERLVFIPRGVAHGAANFLTHAVEILYFMSAQYNKDAADEQRLPWDAKGREFWEIHRE
jgi:dTDP-4-dehydrorhamnose 3,5-epimerase